MLPLAGSYRPQAARAQSAKDTDITAPQSPSRPAPKWLKIIDQGGNDPRLKGYFTPAGVKVEIVAEEPVVINPVGMAFGDDGTSYVLEWRPSPGDDGRETQETFTYKDGTKRSVAAMKKKVKDAVKVLQDTKDKGVYDQSKVILEDEMPSGILLHDGWIYLSGRGTVRRFRPNESGGASVKEVVAQGFGGFHQHQVSGLTIGGDGLLYISTGDGDNYVEGSDGSRATVLRTGAVFRCRPDGSQIRTFAVGFQNPYRDVAFDLHGNMFHADNDSKDGEKYTGCRLLHVADGGDFGWRLRQGARLGRPDKLRSAVHGELPGKMPPLLGTGRGAPAGLLIYNDTRFPEEYGGLLYYPDVLRKLIRAYKVEPRGASFAVTEEFEFLKSDDPLFRPCQMVAGPDGAMYVVDWRTDSSGAGKLSGDGAHGRIYRISWAGTKEKPALPPRSMDSWMRVVRQSDDDLLKTLAGNEASDRTKAQRELVRRGERNRPALLKLLGDGEQPVTCRVAALGVLESFWNEAVRTVFQQVLENGEEPLRRLAAEGLGRNAPRGDRIVHDCLLKALADNDLSVRRAVALAMGRLAAPGAADALVNALAFDDSGDVFLRDGILRGIEELGKPGIDRLLALAESGVAKDTDSVVEAFAALRTRAAYEGLPVLLKYPHLKVEQRVKLLRSCGNYLLDPPISLDPIVAYLNTKAGEPLRVKLAGVELLAAGGTVKERKTEDWLLGLPSWAERAVKEGMIARDEETRLRAAVIAAVEKMRLTRAIGLLTDMLKDDRSASERDAVLKALRALGER
jgi:putative membrane-bound dehydrogenase-like protein